MMLKKYRHCLKYDGFKIPLAGILLLGFLSACSSDNAAQNNNDKVIVVPSTATTTPNYRGDGSVPARRYVVRMSDGERDWEVEFPEVATGYELSIPLEEKGGDESLVVGGDQLTDADKQLLNSLRRRNINFEREGIYENGKNKADPDRKNQVGGLNPGEELNDDGTAKPGEAAKPVNPNTKGGADPWAGTEDKPAPTRRSYFLGLENVKKLYRANKYELAIVYLKKLEKDYPNDLQIMSMLGTLWLKMGQQELAREYWERVLQVNPGERAVIAALKRLNASQGQKTQAPKPEKKQAKPAKKKKK